MADKPYNDFQEIALYYDELYVKPEKYQKEAQQVIAFCQKYKKSCGNSLLDIACGTGGHIAFLKDTYQVTGLDLSNDMLNVARRKFPHISFFNDNMISFSLPSKFDIIMCLYGSIGFVKTLSNLNQTMRTMKNHLLPGGLVILVPWSTAELFSEAVIVDSVNHTNLKLARMENVKLKDDKLAEVTFYHLIWKDGEVRYHTQSMEVGLFAKEEYITAFGEAGLDLMEYYTGPEIGMGAFVGRSPL